MPDIDEIRLDRAEKIELESKWECGEHEYFSQEHIEECLSEMLAAYIGDDRNYVVDGAEIECTEMCKVSHCIKYEDGKTKLYNVTWAAKGVERDYIPPGKELGKAFYFGKDPDMTKVRRLYTLHAKEASDNGIRFATVLDRDCLRDVREGAVRPAKPDDGMQAACEANIISCGNCRIIRESDIAEIEKRWDESMEYGTCYSLIKPVTEWINPPCVESVSGNCDKNSSITSNIGACEIGFGKTACGNTEHHKVMKFDTKYGPKEGLTLLSTLLCTRGGVITIKLHGQIYLDGDDLLTSCDDLLQRIEEKMNMISSKSINTLDEMCGLTTIEILARMIYQESRTFKNGEQNAVVYSLINRLFTENNYTYGKSKTLINTLLSKDQYESIMKYSGAYHPPQTESDGDYGGWENAKRMAAIVMVALEDNVPNYDSSIDIGTVVVADEGASIQDIYDTIGNQVDSCGNEINNPIGDRLSFHAVNGDYEAKDGEIIIYTDGNKKEGGHVFNYE